MWEAPAPGRSKPALAARECSSGPTPRVDLQLNLAAPLVLAFLDHSQQQRGNSARTRNRLAAVRSFMHFLEHRVPVALEQVHRVLARQLRQRGPQQLGGVLRRRPVEIFLQPIRKQGRYEKESVRSGSQLVSIPVGRKSSHDVEHLRAPG